MVYKLLFFALLLLCCGYTFACSCSFPPKIATLESVKNYDFIALVQIEELSPVDTTGGWPRRKTGDFKVSIMQLFKGDTVSVLNEPSHNTSCGYGMKEGEQWIFFGNKGSKMMEINPCTHTTIYREANGVRDWFGFRGMDELNILQKIFNSASNPLQEQIYYANGKIEIQQNFKNGKLNGARKFYYPNGQPFVSEQYKNGKRIGYRKVYALSGQLIFVEKYSFNHIMWKKRYLDTSDIIRDIPMLAKLELGINPNIEKLKIVSDSIYKHRLTGWLLDYVIKYFNNGYSYKSIAYDYSGKIKNKRYSDFKKQKAESFEYYPNGKTQTYNMYDMRKNVQVEYDYKEDGSRRDFLDKCIYCKFYFDKEFLTGGIPEPVYLQ